MSSFSDRLIDSTNLKLNPISGYENELIVSLEESLQPIKSLLKNVDHHIKIAKENCYYLNVDQLTRDQSSSIYLYTMECGEESFYRVLNQSLRSENRQELKRWFLFF